MSNEDKMREAIKKWKHVDSDMLGSDVFTYHAVAYSDGVKDCAAIKDAEIAKVRGEWMGVCGRIQDERNTAYIEIAARDLMIKELREALHNIHCNWDEMHPEDIDKVITEALANSEHHNSHALDKMLLEAELKGLATPDFEVAYTARELEAKLAELNKE